MSFERKLPKLFQQTKNIGSSVQSLAGYQSPVALPRPLGRQPLRVGRAAVPDVPAVPHVRPVYAVGVDPRTSLLRPSGGVPGQVCNL